jgi:hypothetical protein
MRRLIETDGLTERYGGPGEPLLTYALVVEELSRGWKACPGSSTPTSSSRT